jgi:hypothetical protein
MHLHQAGIRAAQIERFDCFARRLGTRSHHHDHPLRVGRSEILEQLVLTASQCGKTVHRCSKVSGKRCVVWIHRLARLKEHVGVLSHTANDGPIRIERPLAMCPNEFVIDHRAHIGVVEDLNLADLV